MKKLVIGLFAVVLAVSLSGCKDKPEEKSKYQVGDVVLCDGTICRGSDKLFSMSEEEILKASAIIYKVDGKKAYGVGIRCSDQWWARETSQGYNEFIDTIQCLPYGNPGNYTFKGDIDGSDNYAQLGEYLISKGLTNDSNSLGEYALLSGRLQTLLIWNDFIDAGLYDDMNDIPDYEIFQDWYLPSVAELFDIYKQKDKVYKIRRLLGYSDPSDSRLWSASTFFDDKWSAWTVDFDDGSINSVDKKTELPLFSIRVF